MGVGGGGRGGGIWNFLSARYLSFYFVFASLQQGEPSRAELYWEVKLFAVFGIEVQSQWEIY